jgi:hypothetical protein
MDTRIRGNDGSKKMLRSELIILEKEGYRASASSFGTWSYM